MKNLIIQLYVSLPCTTVVYYLQKYVYSDFDFLYYLTLAIIMDTVVGIVRHFIFHELSLRLLSRKLSRKIFKYCVLLILGNLASHYTVNGHDVAYINFFHDFICTFLIVREILSVIRNLNYIFPGLIPQWVIKRLSEYIHESDKYSSLLFIGILLCSCSAKHIATETKISELHSEVVTSSLSRSDSVFCLDSVYVRYGRQLVADTNFAGNVTYLTYHDTIFKERYFYSINVSREMSDSSSNNSAKTEGSYIKTITETEHKQPYLRIFVIIFSLVIGVLSGAYYTQKHTKKQC